MGMSLMDRARSDMTSTNQSRNASSCGSAAENGTAPCGVMPSWALLALTRFRGVRQSIQPCTLMDGDADDHQSQPAGNGGGQCRGPLSWCTRDGARHHQDRRTQQLQVAASVPRSLQEG